VGCVQALFQEKAEAGATVATMPATVAVTVSKPVRSAVFIGQVNQD
jgi:hypothetical protein